MKRVFLLLLTLGLNQMQLSAAQAPAVVEKVQQARASMNAGRYKDAEDLLTDQIEPHAARLRIELLERRGERDLASSLARQLFKRYELGEFKTASEKAQAAFAAWYLDQWHDANQIYLEASEEETVPASLYVDWGFLYLEQYNPAEAEGIFSDALRSPTGSALEARWGPEMAYLGLARALIEQGKPGSGEAQEKAAELNPDSLELISVRASQAVRESRWEKADEHLEQGLKLNQEYLPLLEVKGASQYFRGDSQGFDRTTRDILKINPANGSFYELLGDLCIPRRRLEEAIDFYQKSVEKEPRRWSALAALGVNLLRLGREAEGQQALETAYANDPFNILTVNTLRLLDSFSEFDRLQTRHFDVKIRKDEAPALQPYVGELLEKSLQTLMEKYDHQVDGRYVFEIYPDHEDFAVRTLGLPGLGALGATFGRVVAMDSPSARPAGKFHWGSTLWHEVAHVVTLSLSRQKVPRWMTEGLSMMEERLALPGWGDFLSPSFVEAYREGKLLGLAELNAGFERPQFPGQVELSYFQAGWLCDFLSERYGTDKIRQMLVAFGKDQAMEKVFEDVLGDSVEKVDALFKAEMKSVLDPYLERLKEPEKVEVDSPELGRATLMAGVEKNPDNYYLNLEMGRWLFREKEFDEAIPYLQKARELFPFAAGEGSAYDFLLRIYRETSQADLEREFLASRWGLAPRFWKDGERLAELLVAEGDLKQAQRILEEVVYVNPFPPQIHADLGDLYMRTGQHEKALAEYQVNLSLNPPDRAGAHYRVANALVETGDRKTARQQILLALEIAPNYEEAQKLLLKLVRP